MRARAPRHTPLRAHASPLGTANRRGTVPACARVGCGERLGKHRHATVGPGMGLSNVINSCEERTMVSAFMNDDEEPQTQVFAHSLLPNDVITTEASAITSHNSYIHERPTLPAAFAHDVVVDAPPSFFVRAGAWLHWIGKTIVSVRQVPS